MSRVRDAEWADSFWPHVELILEDNLARIVGKRRATDSEDCRRATDLVLQLDRGGEVAVRVRRPRQNDVYRDLTLRLRRRPWGDLSHPWCRGYEADKIIAGFGDWYLYLWVGEGMVDDWLLVDLDVVRSAALIEQAINLGRERVNRDDISSFTWITLEELRQAGAVVATNLPGGTS